MSSESHNSRRDEYLETEADALRDRGMEAMREAWHANQPLPPSAMLDYVDGILIGRLELCEEYEPYGKAREEMRRVYQQGHDEIAAGMVPAVAFGILAEKCNDYIEVMAGQQRYREDFSAVYQQCVMLSTALRELTRYHDISIQQAEAWANDYLDLCSNAFSRHPRAYRWRI